MYNKNSTKETHPAIETATELITSHCNRMLIRVKQIFQSTK